MEREPIEIRKLDDIEIQHFDEDPDGDPDRAGDGLYFQLPGEDSWSGVWHSEDDCYEAAEGDLKMREQREFGQELEEAGFHPFMGDRWFGTDARYQKFARKEDDVYYVLGVGKIGEQRCEVVAVDAEHVVEREGHLMEVLSARDMATRHPAAYDGFVYMGPVDPEGDLSNPSTYVKLAFIECNEGELISSTEFAHWEEDDWQEEFGHVHRAVREGILAVEAAIEARRALAHNF
jgi:hypothetical protein